jgi:hypothetical protein
MSQLLTDSFQFRRIGNPVLTESTHPQGGGKQVYRVSGVFQNYLLKNQNGRLYPKNIWESILKPDSRFMERLQRRNVLGMLEHPEDGITRPELASHVVVEVRIATQDDIRKNHGLVEEGDIVGAYEVLPDEFPKAKILRGMVEANIDFGGVSSRGNGTVSETQSGLVVNEDFELDTWDVVFTPSVSRAKPQLERAPSKPTFESTQPPVTPPASSPKAEDNTEEEPMSKPNIQQESSFCLITGLYGPGPASDDKKFIPIELIQESTTSGSAIMKWQAKQGVGELPKIGIFETAEDAVDAMKMHCEESGASISLNDVTGNLGLGNKGVSESKKTNTPTTSQSMNPKERIRAIQAETVRLTGTDVKNLRISERASLLGVAQDLQIELAEIVQESPALSSLASPLTKKLFEYEEQLDAPEAAPAPAPEGAPAPAPAPEGGMGGEGGEMTAEEAAAKLERCIQALRDCGKEAEATELQGVADQLGDAMGGDVPEDIDGEGDEFGEEPVPEVPEQDFMESMRSMSGRARLRENHNILVNRYNRLARSSAKLLEQVEKGTLSESNPKGEDSKALREAREHANECEKAAREVASRFNKEMIAFGERFWELKRPELYEAAKDRLGKAKTWEDFEKISKAIIAENEKSPTPASKVAESGSAAGAGAPKGNLTEGKDGKEPKKPVTKEADAEEEEAEEEGLEEELHPALRSIRQSRLLAETGSPFIQKSNPLQG